MCTSEFAGVERSLTYVAPELVRRGHEVTVLGGAPRHMTGVLAEAGVHHVPAADVVDAARALARRDVGHPDVVHSHMTAADVAVLGAKPCHRAPCVSTLHFAQPRGRRRWRRPLYQPVALGFREQIAISDYVAATCGTPTVVVPNGVPDRGVEPRSRAPIVLVAQRLEREKHTALALRIWRRSALARAGWQLHVAGRGGEQGALESLAGRLGVAESVRFLGFVDDVPALMAQASVMLATAPGEPFGLSVVEAMAAGLPVVAADGGAHREVLAGFDGQLFRAEDSDAGAATLDALATGDGALEAARRRGRARYEERYTIGRHVDRLLEVYARAAG